MTPLEYGLIFVIVFIIGLSLFVLYKDRRNPQNKR